MPKGNYERGKIVIYLDNYEDDKLETMTLGGLLGEQTIEEVKTVVDAITQLTKYHFAHIVIEEQVLYYWQ